MSASTRRGWWKAPMRFLPWGELMPVLPPTDESTWASREVGACTKRTPRRSVAAANPARSPTTPPPSATTRSFALDLVSEQSVADLREGRVGFRGLAGCHRDEARAQARRLQARAQAVGVERGHVGVGDDDGGLRLQRRHVSAGCVEEAAPDQDVVGPAPVEGHGHGEAVVHWAAIPGCGAIPGFWEFRWASRASITSCTTRSWATSRRSPPRRPPRRRGGARP